MRTTRLVRNCVCALVVAVYAVLAGRASAQGPLLLREAFSREFSLHAGGEQTPVVREVASRELSIFVDYATGPYPQAVSREFSVLVTTLAVPERIADLAVTVSPTGTTAFLDWSSYNVLAQRDVVRFDIYIDTVPFTSVEGRTPLLSVPGESSSAVISNLVEWRDHYFAVVPVDGLGGFDPQVNYGASYVIAPEVISREFSLFVGASEEALYPQALSRELSVLVTTPAVPEQIKDLTLTVSPTGESATLEWSSYNELAQRDVVRYDIYLQATPFSSVDGLTPYASVGAGTFVFQADGLTAWKDHYFAVVPVDGLGGFDPVVEYSASYVLAPEVVSREFSLFAGASETAPYPEAISREVSILVPDSAVPAPVTGVDSGFTADTSKSAFSAVDLDWSSYNEVAQRDVVRYRVYVGSSFFEDVSAMEPHIFAPAGDPTFTVGGLHGGAIYYVAVVAEDALGNFNPSVRAVSVKASIGALGEVRDLAAACSADNEIHLSWVAPEQVDAFLAHYHLYLNAASTPIVLPSSSTSYSITDIPRETAYLVRLATVDVFGTESAGVVLEGATLLDPPADVRAIRFSDRTRLTWSHVEPNELVQEYVVYQLSPPGPPKVVARTRDTRVDIPSGITNMASFFVVTASVGGCEDFDAPIAETIAAPRSGLFSDLEISNLSAPESAHLGQSIPMSWKVRNIGAETAPGSWYDVVVLSPDLVLGDADDIVIHSLERSGPLDPNSSYESSASVTIPASTPLGQYHIFVVTDEADQLPEQFDLGTNVVVAAHKLTIREPAPDLAPVQLVARVADDRLLVEWRTINQGSALAAAPWREEILVSASPDGSNPQVLNTETFLMSIAAGDEAARSFSLTAPDLPLPYYIIVRVDTENELAEAAEGNNQMSSAATLVPCVDPPAGLLGWWRAESSPSDETGRQDGLLHGGTAFALGHVGASFLLDGSDDFVSVPDFPNLGSNSFSIQLWYKAKISSIGRWMKLVNKGRSDSGTPASAGYMLRLELGDLAFDVVDENGVSARAVIPEPVAEEWHFVVAVLDRSLGELRLYVGGNLAGTTPLPANFGSIDTNLRLAFGALDRTGGSTNQEISEFFAGQLDEVAFFEGALSSAEVVSLYNASIAGMCRAPDLQITSATASSPVYSGQSASVTWRTENRGTLPTSSSWKDAVYLSTNPQGVGAQLLTTVTRALSLNPGQGIDETLSATIPANLVGTFYLILRTDAENHVQERTRESNNSYVLGPVTVGPPPSVDLVVSEISIHPEEPVAGQAVTARWRVMNRGAAAAEGTWHDRVRLIKADSGAVHTEHVVEQSGPEGVLAPGESLSGEHSFTLPSGLAGAGTWQLQVLADAHSEILEHDTPPINAEGNNSGVLEFTVLAPPRPDLVVENISVPGTVLPGQTIELTWQTRNIGAVTADGPWTESASLSLDEAVGNDLLLGATPFEGSIAPGASVARVANVTVPLSTAPGNYRVVIAGDSANALDEENEGNNSAVSSGTVAVPAILILQLPVSSIAENAANPVVQALVRRSGPVNAALTVAVTSSDTSEATTPETVTIPAGQNSTVVPITVQKDNVADGSQMVSISVAASGFQSASASLTVLNSDVPRLTLTVTPSTLLEGQSAVGLVSRDTVTDVALTVALSTAAGADLQIPASVVIPANESSATFTVLAVDDSTIEATRTHIISAAAAGFTGATADISIPANDIPILELELDRTTFSEGSGAQAALLTIYREPASSEPLNIQLESGDPSAVLVPASAVIPPGQDAVTVPITAVDDEFVDGPQTTWIFAFAVGAGGSRVAESAPLEVTVTDDDGPTLKVTVTPGVLPEGRHFAGVATISRNTSTEAPLEVALSIDLPGEAVIDAFATIPAGESFVEVSFSTLSDGVTDGSRNVTLTASADGFTSGNAVFIVTDENLPDLVIARIEAPATAASEEFINVSYRIANQGLATANGPWLQRVFLSRDSLIGDDLLVSQYTFSGNMPADLYFEQSVLVRLPLEAGQYWIVVSTDVDQVVDETVEQNNTTISAKAIQVDAPYSATVQAGFETALANTPVPLSGRALKLSGEPAAHALVNIHILVKGTTRVISALADANGNFNATFQPLPGEAGHYQIFATHPGVKSAPVQDEFTLLGLRANSSPLTVKVREGESVVAQTALENLAPMALTGLNAVIQEKSANLEANVSLAEVDLPGNGSATLTVSIAALTASPPSGTISIRVTTAEGVVLNVPVNVIIEPLRPVLEASPNPLVAGMKRGSQRTVDFTISNKGGLATGALTLLLPNASWLSSASGTTLPSLAPGESQNVTLILTPAADLPLGPYTGAIAINGTGASLQLPFTFRAVSEAKGDLKVIAEDEFTYYAEGNPKLAGATVTITDATTGDVVATGTTDTSGEFLAGDLFEGYYDVEVIAEKHTTYRGTHSLTAGEVNIARVFLSRQTVQYIWTVVPTEVEDRTKITIETVFETFVPMPVVTIDPPLIDLAEVTADVTQIDIKIENHGLIAANDLTLNFGSHPNWSLVPLVERIGTLAARSSITIPLTIRRLSAPEGLSAQSKVSSLNDASVPCHIPVNVCWTLVCLGTNTYCGTILVNNAAANCGSPGGDGSVPSGDGTPGGGGTHVYYAGPSFSFPNLCDCSFWDGKCLEGEKSFDLDGLAKKIVEGIQKRIPAGIKIFPDISVSVEGKLCACCIDETLGISGEARGEVKIKLRAEGGFHATIPELPDGLSVPGWDDVSIGGGLFLGVSGTGEGRVVLNLKRQCGGGITWCALGSVSLTLFAGESGHFAVSATEKITGNTYSGEINGEVGLKGSVSAQITDCSGRDLKVQVCGSLGTTYKLVGNLTGPDQDGDGMPEEQPFGFDFSFPFFDGCIQPLSVASAGTSSAMVNPDDTFEISEEEVITPDEVLLDEITQGQTPAGGICARVRLQIDQEAVLTRDAFKATLEIINSGDSRFEDISVELIARDVAGDVRTFVFGVRPPILSGISAVDGSGVLNADTTGTASWILIPSSDAAPDGPRQYFVSGTLRYTQDGVQVTVPLAPAPITVYPNANLLIDYFHQRDVFSDDPFTDVIEPSIPFTLGVMVKNTGKGEARNVRIISGQPQIIENEKGLLVDFKIIATEVAGQNLTPSLTANFGNIAPDELKIGRWLLTSTLQGLFIDYKATFEHLDGLGNPKLSLIENVAIHEMIRMVEAQGPFADGKPDFLVNDLPDLNDYPDTLYLSDGSVEFVSVVETGTVVQAPSAGTLLGQISAAMPPGWTYLRMPEPSDGTLRLVRVVRSDGVEIAFDKNVWVTDRTFIGMGLRPIRENILHLLDYDSTGSYTLFYEPLTAPDLTPPQSAILALPANSGAQIPVQWSGSDSGGGIAFYDIFVAINDGPFLPWLQRTTATAALYEGAPGHRYSFYSVATDFAGNRETAPGAADAQTTVGLANSAPVLDEIDDQEIVEGQVFTLALQASDSNASDMLRFEIVSGAPPGMTIDPAIGIIQWVTGEAHGGMLVEVTVRVTDNGSPALSDATTFRLRVLDQNLPPVIAPIANQAATAGSVIAFNVNATDPDLPMQSLTFSLEGEVPPGAAIDPVSGEFAWNTSVGQAGLDYNIVVRVTDSGAPPLSASQAFQVRVAPGNREPVIQSVPVLTARVGQQYSYLFQAADPDGDALTIILTDLPDFIDYEPGSDNTISFTGVPIAEDVGRRRLGVEVSDGTAVVRQVFDILVEQGDNGPNAVVDTYSVEEDAILSVPAPGVLMNDSDADGDELSALLVTPPQHGTLDLQLDGSFTYLPDANFHGEDTFTYEAFDSVNKSTATTVTITVQPINDPPIATITPDSAVVQYSDPVPGMVLAVTDPDLENSAVTISTRHRLVGGTWEDGLPVGFGLEDMSDDPATEPVELRRLVGHALGGVGEYDVEFTVDDGEEGVSSAVLAVEITREDALVQFVGPTSFQAVAPYEFRTVADLANVSFTGLRLNRATRTFDTVATIKNVSTDTPVRSPLWLVVESISTDAVSLANASGTTPEGQPYILVPLGADGLPPLSAVSNIVLRFGNSANVPFTFVASIRASAPDWSQATAQLDLSVEVVETEDGAAGDLAFANVSFYRDSVALENLLSSGEIPVVPVAGGDPVAGTATASIIYPFTEAEAANRRAELTVLAVLGGRYQGTSSAQTIVVDAGSPAPLSALSRKALILSAQLSNDGRHLVLRINGSRGDVYRVQASSDLRVWEDVLEVRNQDGTATARVPTDRASQFFRISRVSQGHSD